MSYNRSIKFLTPPIGFSVNQIGGSPISVDESNAKALAEYNRGKEEASKFYKEEVSQIRAKFAETQSNLLSKINDNANEILAKLDDRLPDLVLGLAERVLGQLTLDRDSIEQIVRSMVSEFSGDDEKLEVYLCSKDLGLLKAVADPEKPPENEETEAGFASAIAGIFDGLDGDDALLEGYPNVKFFEDSSLQSGDCQIKSRFGLLDGRISTKLRKIEEELKRND